MATQSVDLSKVFTAVTKELKANQAPLNEADTFNHDHGSNMVNVFQTVTKAVKAKKGSPASEQLAYASQMLQNVPSGSAKVYSQNLADAATHFQGKSLTPDSAMQLVTALMGSGQPAQTTAASQDPFGSLLSGMLGGQQTQPAAAAQDPLGGLAGSLLGGLMGGGTASDQPSQASQSKPGLDLNDLMQAGQAFMQAQQKGSSTGEALVAALMAGSSMANSSHRTESGTLIVNTILQVIGSMAKK